MGQVKHYDREYKEEAIKLAEKKAAKKQVKSWEYPIIRYMIG